MLPGEIALTTLFSLLATCQILICIAIILFTIAILAVPKLRTSHVVESRGVLFLALLNFSWSLFCFFHLFAFAPVFSTDQSADDDDAVFPKIMDYCSDLGVASLNAALLVRCFRLRALYLSSEAKIIARANVEDELISTKQRVKAMKKMKIVRNRFILPLIYIGLFILLALVATISFPFDLLKFDVVETIEGFVTVLQGLLVVLVVLISAFTLRRINDTYKQALELIMICLVTSFNIVVELAETINDVVHQFISQGDYLSSTIIEMTHLFQNLFCSFVILLFSSVMPIFLILREKRKKAHAVSFSSLDTELRKEFLNERTITIESDSFETVLTNLDLFNAFKQFLARQFCTENLFFIQDLFLLRAIDSRSSNLPQIVRSVDKMISTYISDSNESVYLLNLPSGISTKIKHDFDEFNTYFSKLYTERREIVDTNNNKQKGRKSAKTGGENSLTLSLSSEDMQSADMPTEESLTCWWSSAPPPPGSLVESVILQISKQMHSNDSSPFPPVADSLVSKLSSSASSSSVFPPLPSADKLITNFYETRNLIIGIEFKMMNLFVMRLFEGAEAEVLRSLRLESWPEFKNSKEYIQTKEKKGLKGLKMLNATDL